MILQMVMGSHQTHHDPTNGDGEQPPERLTAGEWEEFTGTLNSLS